MTELPVVLIVAWVCLALAGGLPAQLPAEPVARRPWLRTILLSAPLVLLLSVCLATAIGLVWPSPALRVYATAPPQFLALKGTIMIPEALYSGLAAVVFVMAGGTRAQTTLLLQEPRLLHRYGVHSRYSFGFDGLRWFESLAFR